MDWLKETLKIVTGDAPQRKNISSELVPNSIYTPSFCRVIHCSVVLNPPQPSSDNYIFDNFYVIGYEDEESDHPSILYQFKENDNSIVDITEFTLPNVETLGENTSNAQRRHRTLPSLAKVSRSYKFNPQNLFVVLFTNDKDQLKFGVCLIDDTLEPEYSFLPSKGPINGWKRKRCFCFTTPYPYFDLYADVLQTIVALESDYQKEKSRPLHTLDVLKLFNEIQPPRLGQNIEFHEKGIDINFTRQAGPKELFHYVSHFGIGVLFSTLGVYQILHILCAIFMEQKVVFASDNLRILSGVVLAFSTFLEPFSLYAPVIPVLPLSMLDTLDAPLPYIIGIPSTRAIYETVKFFPSVVVVDLDQKKGYRGTAPLPKIPRQDKMCAELEALAKSLHEENRGDIYQTNPAIARLREVIYKKITGYVYSLFGDFKLHCICNITDCLVNFFPETFLSGIPAEDTPFYKQFFKTKLFNKYQEDEIKRIKAEITQANYKNNARNQGTRRTAPALPTFLESSAPATSTPTKTPLSPFLSHGGRGQVHRSHSQLSLSSEAAAPSPAPSHLSKPATPSDFLSRSLSLNNIEEYEDLDKVLLRGVEEQTDEGSSDDDSDNEKPDTKDPSNFDDIVL